MSTLYVLDLKNRQEEYSAALEFIKAIEVSKTGEVDGRKRALLKSAERIAISVGNVAKTISPRYFEAPISAPDRGSNSVDCFNNRHKFCEQDTRILDRGEHDIRYHLRIHFGNNNSNSFKESELLHLQYLAMLLKQASIYLEERKSREENGLGNSETLEENSVDNDLKKALTVFMVPITGDKYPFKNQEGNVDYKTYSYVSLHLRLLSKRYTGVIYGVDESFGEPKVTSLNFRKNVKCKTCFPLIIINKSVYELMFVVSRTDILQALFSLKKNGRFGKSRDENPMLALEDFIAETDLYRIRDVIPMELCQEVFGFLKSRGKLSLMELSLFAFMLSDKSIIERSDNANDRYERVWSLAYEMCRGLKQIVQNAIQHTESKECFFSFNLHEREGGEERGSYFNRITRLYPDTYFDMSLGEEALEIFISDLNDKEDMVDNFISNLEYEWNHQIKQNVSDELKGHLKLIQGREKIAIRNFFSEYSPEDMGEEWKAFRQEDLIAHIGLSQFAQTAGKCKASVKVISSKYSEVLDEKNTFYRAYGKEQKTMDSCLYTERNSISVIPGTQFSILIPIQPWGDNHSKGIGQLQQHNCVAEKYVSFASFLEYSEKRVGITINEKGINSQNEDILNARYKYLLVQQWKGYWEKKFREEVYSVLKDGGNKKAIFNFDFNNAAEVGYFDNEDRIEVFLKGFISALNFIGSLDELCLIALTNLPERFIEVFRKVSVQLSVKTFPSRVQICLHEKQIGEKDNKRIVMIGNDFAQAICNSYVLSMGQGVQGFDKEDCVNALEIKTKLMLEIDAMKAEKNQVTAEVCPFDVILSCSESDQRSLFERQLKSMAEGALDEDLIGYKLNDTHMRLGSKVHIESFYEMSFLFYRTTIANRLAFNILRKISENSQNETMMEKRVNLEEDNIIFYGYASYSKAVLTSLNEILREYRKRKSLRVNERLEDRIAVASFQHNLMLESEETQMYFDLPTEVFPGRVSDNNKLILEEKVKVIQIVPISSTLTTFDKMWRRFLKSVQDEWKTKICMAGNYTVFWVVDQNGNLKEGLPSEIEGKYWEKTENSVIKTKLPILLSEEDMEVNYFIRSAVVWNDPLLCELCYPEHVINEVPLVETDPTSTVPTQQIRYKGYMASGEWKATAEEYGRFKELRNCVLYDHICRRQNHYQFYVDTQQYFYNVRKMVKEWLEKSSRDMTSETKEPELHIIFSPEHNTNVGFVQYVNTYYFNGLAEIVSLNVDKQFRSNFICEHAALKRMIEELHRDRIDKTSRPVKFYFVDDTIITGDTLEKANGLLQSLVPENEYPVNLFSKIFVLIDRLSEQTKKMYVEDPLHNFMSFLHIDVSNVRTHGDSCVGCKLEQDAKKLYKRSATRNMAMYWQQKLFDYRKKAYDSKTEIASIRKDEKSYGMLLFCHVLQNVFVKQGNCYSIGDCYDVVLNISLWLLKIEEYADRDIYGNNIFLEGMRNLDGVRMLFKAICRPFFSYDFKIKRQIYTFFIFLTELILGEKTDEIIPSNLEEKGSVSYLTQKNRIPKMERLAKGIREALVERDEKELSFLKDYLLEGLTDMGSTYSMRMQTLKKVYAYLKNRGTAFQEKERIEFWNSYERNIHRLVTGSADESRELWMEYMYLTGMEYKEFYEKYSTSGERAYIPHFFFETITGTDLEDSQDRPFYQFCHNLFLQNTGINFDQLEEVSDARQGRIPSEGTFLKAYWKQMRNLDEFENPFFIENQKERMETACERELFDLLKSRDAIQTEKTADEWYGDFLNRIVDVIGEKYDISKEDINIALLTENIADRNCVNTIQSLDFVRENINSRKVTIPETRYYIKERVVNALKKEELFYLERNGYTIASGAEIGGEKRPYIIALFDHPRRTDAEVYGRSLTRVFLYISIPNGNNSKKAQFDLRLILREVLLYRNRIQRFLERDFAGKIYASYARTIGETNILSHEKAHSHNTTGDDEISLEIFQGIKRFGKKSDYVVLTREQAADWLLLRNYTNGQIAKLFNRGFHDSKDEQNNQNEKEVQGSPRLYIPQDSINYYNKVFKEKLDFFSKLNLKNENKDLEDGRFKLLNEIVDIRYDSSMNNAEFIRGSQGQFYNLEYFKCILIDIMISAIKYETARSDYLTRVDRLLEIKGKLNNEVQLWDTEDEEIAGLIKRMKDSCCYIEIFREESPIDGIDYLVIKNPVDEMVNRLKNWEEQNQIILQRLEDPLDYADGHMSLIAIKRYIEKIDETRNLKCDFRYIVSEPGDGETKKLYFENRLPVLKRR